MNDLVRLCRLLTGILTFMSYISLKISTVFIYKRFNQPGTGIRSSNCTDSTENTLHLTIVTEK